MGKLYSLGDIHLSALHPWSWHVGRAFLDWLEGVEVEPDSEMVLLGDATERDTNPGDVLDLLEQLFIILTRKFRHIYIVVGNHDLKVYRRKLQLVYRFVQHRSNFTIIEKPLEEREIMGLRCVFLPHIRSKTGCAEDEYNTMLPAFNEAHADSKWNIAFAHLTIKGTVPMIAGGVERALLPKADYLNFGHIHTRVTPDYAGSVTPNNILEANSKRVMTEFSLGEDGTTNRVEHEIPEIVVYEEVTFPNAIPARDDGKIHLYTVIGQCGEQIAKDHYSNNYVYRVRNTYFYEKKAAKKNKVDAKSDELFVCDDFVTALEDMVKETKIHISDPAMAILKEVLAPAQTA